MVLAMGAEAGVAGWLCFYAARELSFSAALAGSAISLFWAGMLVGRLLTSSLSGGVRLVLLIIICPAGACLAWLGVTASGAAAAIMPLLFVAGAFHSGTFPLILAYAKTKYEDVFGSAAGLLIAIGTVGGMLTPYLIGFAGERIGLRAAIGGIALLQLGIVLLACALLARDSDARHQGTAAM
jgi:FHS family glucose/mannose:H+ symporter-like MFS transporter